MQKPTTRSRKLVYDVWFAMISRCTNPKHPYYSHYGARGIRVCERWSRSFDDFRDDMGPKPKPEYTLDRIDNDGDYCPSNCRWATPAEQCNNTRRTRFLTVFGETKNLKNWSDDLRCRVSYTTLQARIANGWDAERAITKPAANWGRIAAASVAKGGR